ncbi:hypothetical protein F471_00488 [Pseudomonas sp. URMO17WK12:I1]|uniref:hypothetical protein n=1 Tax=unclassified Pseudomonas TaxID=196821 RepID=UPI00047F224E|nr:MULTISPECIES: hypothetical protein [unclassified Pseudomonas]PZW71414.1 hypothetical protein F471_00488 [Pseudomonas sp. URMO17WK12:I1]
MYYRLPALFLFALLTGCGTIAFDPPVFDLAASKIADFPVKGTVTIENAQPATEPVILHSQSGTRLQSSNHEVTKTMVTQARFELARHGKVGSGSDKRIDLKVTHLESRYIFFYWKGTMTFTVSLGDGQRFDLTINHATGASAQQDLSGSIADGVVALYKDPRVLAYLAK